MTYSTMQNSIPCTTDSTDKEQNLIQSGDRVSSSYLLYLQ